VNIFTRSLGDDLASLVKQVDEKVAQHKDEKMAAFVVLLTDDPDAAEAEVKAFAEKHGIKNTPLTIFDGVAGPPNYKIAKEAEVTVNLWRNMKAVANHAFAKGQLDDKATTAVAGDVEKLVK